MVEIKFFYDNRGGIHLTLRGHAGAAPKGEDMICAACTTLAYTAAQAVQFMKGQGKLAKNPKISIAEGKATIIATPKKDAEAELLMAYWTVQCGAHVLSHNYPKHVRLEPLRINRLDSSTYGQEV
jgi:uncharacterized protein YsxB (DUF464 family)